MSNWFAIDASDKTCSVGYLAMGQNIVQYISDGHKKHTDVLLPAIAELLYGRQTSEPGRPVDLLAVTVGPGAFSGVRVACVVAQAIAFAANAKVIPVISTAAWASVAFAANLDAKYAWVAMDARMNQVYWACYQRLGDGMEVLADVTLEDWGKVIVPDVLRTGTAEVITVGSAWQAYPEMCTGLRAKLAHCDLPISAQAVIQVAQVSQLEPIEPEALEPLYLRKPV